MNIRRLGLVLGLAFSLFVTASFDAVAHSGSVIEGTITRLFGDPHPDLRQQGARQQRLPILTADDGHVIALDLSAVATPAGGWRAVLNKRVRVTADANVRAESMSFSERFAVRRLEVLTTAFSSFEAVTGNQKYISLLCKFSNLPAFEPETYLWFTDQVNSNVYPNFNHYFREVSYDTLNLDGSTATTGWLTLPKSKATYISESGNNPNVYLPNMFTDCVGLHNPSVDFSQFYGINMMFNDKVDDCCAWGGTIGATLDGKGPVWPVTWMPFWGAGVLFGWNDHGVLAHEMSHAFGSGHSNDPSGYEYGNSFDVVSNPCGTGLVIDVELGCVGQHQIAHNKTAMGIIPGARIGTQAAGSAATVHNIERMAQPPGVVGTLQMLKITVNSSLFYTVESRKRVGYDQNIPGDGVLIHRVLPTSAILDPEATLVAPTGTTGGANALWGVGTTFINPTNNFKVTVNSISADGTANVTVAPATEPGQYTFALAGYTVTEGGPAVNLVVNRTAPFTGAGSVTWTTSNGTAIAGTDFGTAGNPAQRTGTLTWTAGTGGSKMISVVTGLIPVINDTTQGEVDAAFNVALSAPVGGVLGAQNSTVVTIRDSDSTISFDGTSIPVNEVGPNVIAQIIRTGATTLSQSVTWRTANGTALLGSDFGPNAATVQPTGVVTFAPGETVKSIAIGPTSVAAPYVRINNDTTVEGPEAFTIVLSAPTAGAVLGGASVATVTVSSDEQGVSMGAATVTLQETAGATTINATRSGTPTGPLTVNYSFVNGTGAYAALNGTHFTGVNGQVSWVDGEGGSKPIPVTILDNAAPNTARTFSVTLSGASVGVIAAPTSTTVSIADNDNTVQFAGSVATVAEGVAGSNLSLQLTRTGINAGQAASVTWTAYDGTALAGTDYGLLGNATAPTGTVNWAANDGAAKTIMIPILNDTTVEGAKNFTVVLSAPVGPNLTIGANPQVTVTLNDNDAGIAFAQAVYNVTEGTNPSVTLTVQRIGPANLAASATWATVNGTATSGQDFGLMGNAAPRTGTLSWLAGQSTAKTIVIPIINDALGGEGPESFTVVLTPGGSLVLGTPGTATVNITDDDIPPQSTATFSAPKYTVLENAGPAQLFVNRVDLGGGFGLAASVNYALQPGTALATSDYTVVTGTLNWGAGLSDQKTINIPIVNNTTPESHESFKVLLSGNSPGLGIATPEASVLILDDDEVFPLDGAVPGGWSVPGGAFAGWFVSNDPGAYEGVFALKSEQINDGQAAGISYTDNFLAGTLTFRVKISSEANFDVLRFYLDGSPVASWSGTANTTWQLYSVPIAAGVHTFHWSYEKDGSVTVGSDAASIDGVVMPPLAP